MKKHTLPEAVHRAVALEYTHKAPESLRLRIRALMHIPLVKPWQLVGSILLLLAAPLSLYLFRTQIAYSDNLMLTLNVSFGAAAFLLIFAGVAHRYSDPQNKADLIEKLNALKAKI